MAFIKRTPGGKYKAHWRTAGGTQTSKTFETRREATAFLAETQAALNRGTYVSPSAGRQRFSVYAERWMASRSDEITTKARDASIMRTHVLPRWGSTPLNKIDHSSMQTWISELNTRLSPATVRECSRIACAVIRLAVRDRVIGLNPCDDLRLPRRRRTDNDEVVIAPDVLVRVLLPQMPNRYRALVAVAGGTGLRWGEVVGLRWDAVDLDHGRVRVIRTAVEVAGTVTAKAYPKSRAGRREVPLPPFAVDALIEHRSRYPAGPAGEVFTNSAGGPVRRTLFRTRVWRPALVRAGLLGGLAQLADGTWLGTWSEPSGDEQSVIRRTRHQAVIAIARSNARGLRFHELRHSYATWLVSSGVPINDVAGMLGHEQMSTTLDRYTHSMADRENRIRATFASFSLPTALPATPETTQGPSEKGP
ncbi:tyrosine-type recombinase/integrase [Sporichthya polymorpha]|uniref:tyrosine-type recombinase/integrase n=1 Tax=Sporichthya polymorpha TaxID=35751 RepID=UPI00036E389E|nr:site-specific integrase [Sporichthya polymorpha]